MNSRNDKVFKLSRWATMLGASSMCLMMGATTNAEEVDDDQDNENKIVITGTQMRSATKTDADVMEIPQSISVITADQFAERGAINFQDIFRYSAGVSTEDNGVDTRYDSFSARGFATVQYLDGLNRQPDFIYGARMEVFTLERAEVLRGPSAVLYGAGSAGGLFNGVSKTPKHDFGGEFGVQFGTDNRKQIMADVTGEFSDDLASRFVGVLRDGELQPEDQADDRFLLMPSISWSGDDTDITFLVLYNKDDMGTHTYYGLDLDADKLPIDFFAGDKDYNHIKTTHKSGTLMVDHYFTDDISYSGRTRYSDHVTDYAEVYGFYPDSQNDLLGRSFYFLDENYQVLNSDHNVKFDIESGVFKHQILVGIDYTEFEQDREEGWGVAPTLDLNNPDYHTEFSQDVLNAYTSKSTQLGVYLQDQIKYDDWLSIVLGVRRDKSTSELTPAGLARTEEEPNHATTRRIGVIGDIGNGFSPYISYSESFQPIFGADFYGVPFKPQSGEQTEVGLKYQPAKDTLITVAYYDVEESNRLTPDPDEIQNFLQAGSIASDGYEIEVSTRLFETLSLTAAYSHTDSKVLDSNPDVADLKVANIPETLASVWVMNEFFSDGEMSFNAGLGVRYVSDKTDANNLYVTPSFTLVDISMGLTYEDWSFRINANNVLNKEYYATCSELGPSNIVFCAPAMDRSAVATLTRHF